MIRKKITELNENPKNYKNLDDDGFARLVEQMKMGDHSTWLITPENMIVDGNMRKKAALTAGWEEVECRVLSFEKNEQGYYALIDGVVVRDHEVIPYYYKTVDEGIMAYALSRNSHSGYYNDDFFNSMPNMTIDYAMFSVDIKPPESITEMMANLVQKERKKKLLLLVPCDDETQLEQRYQKITELGIPVKKKI